MKNKDETTTLEGVGSTVGLERAFYEWLTEPQPPGITAHEWNSTRLKIAFLAGAEAEREACAIVAETYPLLTFGEGLAVAEAIMQRSNEQS
jgi:hypothetical protein